MENTPFSYAALPTIYLLNLNFNDFSLVKYIISQFAYS